MDIELAVNAMEIAGHIDHMVLFSGDGDFRSLVEAVQRRGVRVTVVSTVTTQPPMIADELRRQADVFLDITELRNKVGRDPLSGRNALHVSRGRRENIRRSSCSAAPLYQDAFRLAPSTTISTRNSRGGRAGAETVRAVPGWSPSAIPGVSASRSGSTRRYRHSAIVRRAR